MRASMFPQSTVWKNRLAADDFDEEIIPKDRRIYRMAWLSEIQARWGNTQTVPWNRIEISKDNPCDNYYSNVGIVDIPTDEEMEQKYMQRTTR